MRARTRVESSRVRFLDDNERPQWGNRTEQLSAAKPQLPSFAGVAIDERIMDELVEWNVRQLTRLFVYSKRDWGGARKICGHLPGGGPAKRGLTLRMNV